MGTAIILEGCDFSSKNLGKVTFLEDADLVSISITGKVEVEGLTSPYNVTYAPANTSQRGVTWSIQSGGEYASINQQGLLSIKQGAVNKAVVIKATSVIDSTIIATQSVNVTYSEVTDELYGISIDGPASVDGMEAQYTTVYDPSNTTQKGVTWSIESGGQYASIDENGLLKLKSGASASSVTIKATSTSDATIAATKQVTVTYTEPVVILISTTSSAAAVDGVTVNGIRTDYYVDSNSNQKLYTISNKLCGNAIKRPADFTATFGGKFPYTKFATAGDSYYKPGNFSVEQVEGYPFAWFSASVGTKPAEAEVGTSIAAVGLKDLANGIYKVRIMPYIPSDRSEKNSYLVFRANEKTFAPTAVFTSTPDAPSWITLNDVQVTDGSLLIGSELSSYTSSFPPMGCFSFIEITKQ